VYAWVYLCVKANPLLIAASRVQRSGSLLVGAHLAVPSPLPPLLPARVPACLQATNHLGSHSFFTTCDEQQWAAVRKAAAAAFSTANVK
jgi:hypothetical protein